MKNLQCGLLILIGLHWAGNLHLNLSTDFECHFERFFFYDRLKDFYDWLLEKFFSDWLVEKFFCNWLLKKFLVTGCAFSKSHIYKGYFNKDARFLNVNKTSCVWDIYSIFFYLKEYFMVLVWNITSLKCPPRLRLVTCIRVVQFSMIFSHKSDWIYWMAFVMLTLRAIVCGSFMRYIHRPAI